MNKCKDHYTHICTRRVQGIVGLTWSSTILLLFQKLHFMTPIILFFIFFITYVSCSIKKKRKKKKYYIMHMSAVMRELSCAATAFSVRPLLLKETLVVPSVYGHLSTAWPLVLKVSLLLSPSFCFQSSLSSLVCSWTLTSKKRSGECTQGIFFTSWIDTWHIEILFAELEREVYLWYVQSRLLREYTSRSCGARSHSPQMSETALVINHNVIRN